MPPMATTVSAPLSAEPSIPEERNEQHLPPKSYVDAVEEKSLPVHTSSSGETDNVKPKKKSKKARKAEAKKKMETEETKETNGNNEDESTLVQEKFDDANLEGLTSVKPSDQYQAALRQNQIENQTPKQSLNDASDSLVSGRQAGAGWQRSRVRWAPLNVPLQRRLQTLMVLFHTLCIALSLSLFFFLCAIPLFWPILLPYLVYCLWSSASTSGTLSHRSNRFRSSSVWSLFASYFPARLHRSQELPATRKYVFGYHPHGIISHGAFAAFATEALGFSQLFPGITNTLLTLDSNFRIPIYRDYALAMGLASVSRESCENLLSKGGTNGEGMGRAITIVVGGARESLDSQPRSLRLVLKRRLGFVKLAIRTGADLVPVLAFGENDLYDVVLPHHHPFIFKAQMVVKKLLGFTIPLFHARGVFNYDVGLMPYRRPLNVVVGKPLKVQQQLEPDSEYVNKMHEDYIKELERMWEEWKDVFAKDRMGEMEIAE